MHGKASRASGRRGGRLEISMLGQIPTPIRIVVPAILLAALLHAQSVRAEIRIAGGADAVQVEARDAPVEEVLSGLRARFGLQYRNAASLDRRVSGTYEGSLQRVVRRLLEGYDFVLKSESGTVEVVVVGAGKPGGARPAPALAPAASAATAAPTAAPPPVPPTRKRRAH